MQLISTRANGEKLVKVCSIPWSTQGKSYRAIQFYVEEHALVLNDPALVRSSEIISAVLGSACVTPSGDGSDNQSNDTALFGLTRHQSVLKSLSFV